MPVNRIQPLRWKSLDDTPDPETVADECLEVHDTPACSIYWHAPSEKLWRRFTTQGGHTLWHYASPDGT